MEWDPSILDYEYDKDNWHKEIKQLEKNYQVKQTYIQQAQNQDVPPVINSKQDETTTKPNARKLEYTQTDDQTNGQTTPTNRNISIGVSTSIVHIDRPTLLQTLHQLSNGKTNITPFSISATSNSSSLKEAASLGGEEENPSKKTKTDVGKDLQHSKLCDFDGNGQESKQYHPVRIIKLAENYKDTLHELGFKQQSGTDDLWMRSHDGVHVYVLKFKGTEKMSFHLNMDTNCDKDDVLHQQTYSGKKFP